MSSTKTFSKEIHSRGFILKIVEVLCYSKLSIGAHAAILCRSSGNSCNDPKMMAAAILSLSLPPHFCLAPSARKYDGMMMIIKKRVLGLYTLKKYSI